MPSACGPEVNRAEEGQEENAQNEEQVVDYDHRIHQITATFSQAQWRSLMQGLSNDVPSAVLYERVLAVDLPQEENSQQVGAQSLRREAMQDAEDKITDAIEAIRSAEEACGRPMPGLQAAQRWLQELTDPPARGAAEAQRLLHRALSECPEGAERAIKKADRDVRDIVVLRCRACCADPKDRDGFLVRATEAYEGDMDKETRAQLLLAYHKDRHSPKSRMSRMIILVKTYIILKISEN